MKALISLFFTNLRSHLETMYNFTELAVQLNEPEEGVAPTDTRLRPDQRLMEEAKWDEANEEKIRLEDKQRAARKKREAEYALKHPNMDSGESSAALGNSQTSFYLAGANNNSNGKSNNTNANSNNSDDMDDISMNNVIPHASSSHDPEPVWFKKSIDPYTNQPIHLFKNEYWDCKANKDWSRCPDLF
jgi:hypothetical protein